MQSVKLGLRCTSHVFLHCEELHSKLNLEAAPFPYVWAPVKEGQSLIGLGDAPTQLGHCCTQGVLKLLSLGVLCEL